MTHNNYRMTMRLKRVKEIWFKYECVWFAKHYSTNVHGITLGSFNGSAKKATYKTWGTFDPQKRNQYKPWPTVAILEGDILILDTPWDGHVCIWHNQVNGWYYVMEQNRNNTKTGQGQDAINIWWYDYSTPIINIYRKK